MGLIIYHLSVRGLMVSFLQFHIGLMIGPPGLRGIPIQSAMKNHPVLPGLRIHRINLNLGGNGARNQITYLSLQAERRHGGPFYVAEIMPVEFGHMVHLLSIIVSVSLTERMYGFAS
jgi:hypothetical protein